MEFKDFIDRKDYLERVNNALQREKPQFIVIYGRRRIGKSKLIREIMDWKRKDIYFLSDQTNEANQRMLFAKTATMVGRLRQGYISRLGNTFACLEPSGCGKQHCLPWRVSVSGKKLPFSAIRHTKAAQREMPEVQSYPLRFFTTTDAGLHIG